MEATATHTEDNHPTTNTSPSGTVTVVTNRTNNGDEMDTEPTNNATRTNHSPPEAVATHPGDGNSLSSVSQGSNGAPTTNRPTQHRPNDYRPSYHSRHTRDYDSGR